MELTKQLSISLLGEMLTTIKNTHAFAESKLQYIDTSLCARNAVILDEFMQQKHRCEVKINQIEACITWIKTLENENINTPKAETKNQ